MKRLVFCFDGSWNKLTAAHPTNVVLTAESVRPTTQGGTAQIVYYDEGVGTSTSDRFRGGAMGVGLETNIREAYRFLIFNYEPGDEIFAFGFSRGAYTARSFVGFIRCAGIPAINYADRIDRAITLYKEGTAAADHALSDAAREFRFANSPLVFVDDDELDWRASRDPAFDRSKATKLTIKYVGVWDTVGALGVPAFVPGSGRINRRYRYHFCDLTPGVEYARHAVAIDERRTLFAPTLWGNIEKLNRDRGFEPEHVKAPYQQKWFPGGHGSVGGGGPERRLSDDALGWVLAGAKQAGLKLNAAEGSRIFDIRPNYRAALYNDPDNLPWHDRGAVGWLKSAVLAADRSGPERVWEVSAAARRRWNAPAGELHERMRYRPGPLAKVASELDRPAEVQASMPVSGILATHTVVRGDTLGKLAKLHYGDAALWVAIAEANRDVIDDPDEIFLDTVLKIPDIGPAAAPTLVATPAAPSPAPDAAGPGAPAEPPPAPNPS